MSTSSVASLSQRLGKGTPLITAWTGIPDPLLAGVLAREEFDAVVLDMQHGAHDIHSIIPSIAQVALAGKPAIVRIPVGQFETASRALDLGASGIIAPMINCVEDARLLAAYTKYPPVGERSWGPAITLGLTGHQPSDYLKAANSLHVTIAMVETREALAALDDILSVDGIDGVLVGPSDLSIALSNGGHVDQTHADVFSALDHVLKRCRHHKKAATVFAPTGPMAHKLAKDGFDLLSLGTDIMQVRTGVKATIEAYRKG
jgi:4-hydroxy-2-oxoheptanedioate aldolase